MKANVTDLCGGEQVFEMVLFGAADAELGHYGPQSLM